MAKRSKMKEAVINAAKRMPPLFHKFPNEKFDIRRSRTMWWLTKQPEVLNFIWYIVEHSGAVEYDRATGKWTGVDFMCEEDDED